MHTARGTGAYVVFDGVQVVQAQRTFCEHDGHLLVRDRRRVVVGVVRDGG